MRFSFVDESSQEFDEAPSGRHKKKDKAVELKNFYRHQVNLVSIELGRFVTSHAPSRR
jgi:hypothetical protein